MSFILKAQNKSEGAEQIPPKQGLNLTDYRYLIMGSVCLLMIISISLAIFSDFRESTDAQRNPASSFKQSILEESNAALSASKQGEKKINEKILTNKQKETSPKKAAIEVSNLASSSSANDKNLNEINITSHIYTEDPTQRAIFINDQIYRIGDKYQLAEIRDITPTGLVFRINQNQKSEDLHISLSDKWSLK